MGDAVGVTRGEVELFEGVLAEVVQLGGLVAALEENQFPVAVADPAMGQVEGWLLERAGSVLKDLAKDLRAGQGGSLAGRREQVETGQPRRHGSPGGGQQRRDHIDARNQVVAPGG